MSSCVEGYGSSNLVFFENDAFYCISASPTMELELKKTFYGRLSEYGVGDCDYNPRMGPRSPQ